MYKIDRRGGGGPKSFYRTDPDPYIFTILDLDHFTSISNDDCHF